MIEVSSSDLAYRKPTAGIETGSKAIQAALTSRILAQNVRLAFLGGPKKGNAIFLETPHHEERKLITGGILRMMDGGFQLLGKVEETSLGISDTVFDHCLNLFTGIQRLVIPKTSQPIPDLNDIVSASQRNIDFAIKGYLEDRRGYCFKKRPTAFLFHNRSAVSFETNHTVPVVTTYTLTSLKGHADMPDSLSIEIMPDDYRYYKHGYHSIEKQAIQGADKGTLKRALIQAGAPPETISKILETAEERFAYVKISAQGITLRIEAIDEPEKVALTLKLPEHLTVDDPLETKPCDANGNVTFVNTAEGAELRSVMSWLNNTKKGDFHTFLKLLNTSLKGVAVKQF